MTATSLNVRSGPGVTYVAVASVARGTRLQILGRQGEWYRVVLPGQAADPARYVAASFVALE